MRDLTTTGNRINSDIGKAIGDYGLIEKGDRILVAVSGGKDSLTLLKFLKEIRKWAPVKYDILAVHVKTDLVRRDSADEKALRAFLKDTGVECVFKEIKVLDKTGKTSCFWCSWNRRKVIFETADELGCNKVALGHHKDDIAETMLINLLYQGEISAINPRQDLFGGKITLIRPLCYVEESLIEKFAKESRFPREPRACPFGGDSRREYIRKFLKEAEKKTPEAGVKTNILKSLARIRKDYIGLEVAEKEKN